MNGMIFAAGLGTRLSPLTDATPKALVKLGGRPLLDYAIRHLASAGVNNIVINVHHFADQIKTYVERNRDLWNADIVISDETEELLETGGGLAKALPLFPDKGPIIVGNVDVVSNTSLRALIKTHQEKGNDATLLTSHRISTRNLIFDAEGLLCGWVNKSNGQTRMVRTVPDTFGMAFNGFHIIEQHLVKQFLPARPLPIVTAYLDNANEFSIGQCEMSNDYYWFDIGTPSKLAMAEEFLYG